MGGAGCQHRGMLPIQLPSLTPRRLKVRPWPLSLVRFENVVDAIETFRIDTNPAGGKGCASRRSRGR